MSISRRNWFFKGMGLILGGSFFSPKGQAEEISDEAYYKVYPVGKVRKNGATVTLEVFDKYKEAIKGLDAYSHVFVMYWFDKNDTPEKRSILQVHPMGNKKNPLTGVFACRSPFRPNLIALSLCEIQSIKDNTIVIDNIDAFDDTPIIDLKPYVPALDSRTDHVRYPTWLR